MFDDFIGEIDHVRKSAKARAAERARKVAEFRRRLDAMTPEQRAEYKAAEAARLREYRQRARQTPKTEDQLQVARAARNERMKRYREGRPEFVRERQNAKKRVLPPGTSTVGDDATADRLIFSLCERLRNRARRVFDSYEKRAEYLAKHRTRNRKWVRKKWASMDDEQRAEEVHKRFLRQRRQFDRNGVQYTREWVKRKADRWSKARAGSWDGMVTPMSDLERELTEISAQAERENPGVLYGEIQQLEKFLEAASDKLHADYASGRVDRATMERYGLLKVKGYSFTHRASCGSAKPTARNGGNDGRSGKKPKRNPAAVRRVAVKAAVTQPKE